MNESWVESEHFAAPSMTSHDDAESYYSSGTRETAGGTSVHEAEVALARNETKAVNRSKMFVLLILVLAAATCGSLTYHYTTKEEEEDFLTQFHGFSAEIMHMAQNQVMNTFRSVKSSSTSVTSLAEEIKVTWPFVTIPHFKLRGFQLNELSHAIMVGFSPIITEANRPKWESYANINQGWVMKEEGIDVFRKYNNVSNDNSSSLEELATVTALEKQTTAYAEAKALPLKNNNDDNTNNASNLPMEPELISPSIFRLDDNNNKIPDNSWGPFLPLWQLTPAPPKEYINIVNYNLISHPVFSRVYNTMLRSERPVLSEVFTPEFLYESNPRVDVKSMDHYNVSNPHSLLFHPVYGTLDGMDDTDIYSKNNNKNDIKGVIYAIISWDKYFTNLIPDGVRGTIVVSNTCNDTFTYELNGRKAEYRGKGDHHEKRYDALVVSAPFVVPSFASTLGAEGTSDINNDNDSCEFLLQLYPSLDYEIELTTTKSVVYTSVVLLVFYFTTMVFVVYDFLVQRRQEKVMETAKRSNAIVSSLFPSNVRERIMRDAEEQYEAERKASATAAGGFRLGTTKNKLKDFLGNGGVDMDDDSEGGGGGGHGVHGSKPIADLFPNATVLFADIVGFTAWSSVREPSQVFQLLETLYHAFDEIAKRRRVFKVETVGDCYVAVTGLPEPRQDHAIVMARFARDCLSKMNDLSKKLEVSLGPDTGDLCMRIGLNSGPVTAGVLRGEKSRFQLFGDTVNTASRMESNGARNRIHVSQETATLLMNAGKSHWVVPREDKIVAKGKGELQTYWLELDNPNDKSYNSGSGHTDDDDDEHAHMILAANLTASAAATTAIDALSVASRHSTGSLKRDNSSQSLRKDDAPLAKPVLSDKVERLVQWNVDVLLRLIKQIVARRNVTDKHKHRVEAQRRGSNRSLTGLNDETDRRTTVLDEVAEIIKLPKFDAYVARKQEDPNSVEMDPAIAAQLTDYVTVIATMYRDNPFHNFEHASHVTMSVVKLLSRIVAPDEVLYDSADDDDHKLVKNLHDHTYGITSDPLTQFAVVFSALIHDVDHTGVPNAQLVKERSEIALVYNNKSVAEQNSVDIAWDLLMDPCFEKLRSVIYANSTELKRFRQLVVNTVMATDIVDKELKELRNARWEKAFQERESTDKETREDVNRKATIVIEHLIQASDVAHTMQHWHIYRKWNERFFQEMLHAYRAGRAEKNPADFWYEGEMGFFDFYIIPLAKKLKECGVFGVSSDEYLNYAITNRKEWESKGQAAVHEMVEKYKDSKFNYWADQCKLGETETLEDKPTIQRKGSICML